MLKLNVVRIVYRRETTNVVNFVNVQMKIRYDNKHKSLMFKIDNYVYFRLHYEYQLLNKSSKFFLINMSNFF